jgi:LPS sulfotransferase NodH
VSRFDAFVLFAEMRTGSNHLEASINAMDGVECLGELFNPHFMGQHNRFELDGIDMAARAADPLALLGKVKARPGLSGFRIFHDHDPRVIEAVLPDPKVAKIVLGRNPVESYVSLKIAQATGQWKLTNPKMAKAAQAEFDGAEFDAMLNSQRAFRARLTREMQITGQTAFWIDYADIGDLDVVNGIAGFLGLDTALEELPGKLKRQNPGETLDKVANPDALTTHLAGLDPYALHGLPGTEGPRGAAVPRMMAAGRILYLPIPGGPIKQTRQWLSAQGEIENSFSQKTLRQWLRGHKGMEVITVLRHPLARAHDVFADHVLSESGEAIRRLLVRHYQAPISEKGEVSLGRDDYRTCFEAFLRFAKANLGGQTALPPGARWGHQLVALQGMAQIVFPTRLLREQEATAELARIAPDAPPWMPPLPGRLTEIYDDALEDLALEIWRRDYLTFGFKRWGH